MKFKDFYLSESTIDKLKTGKKYYLVVIQNYKGSHVYSVHSTPGGAFRKNIPSRITHRNDYQKKIVVSDVKKLPGDPMPDISTLQDYNVSWEERLKG